MNFLTIGSTAIPDQMDIREEQEIHKAFNRLGHLSRFVDTEKWKEGFDREVAKHAFDYIFLTRSNSIGLEEMKYMSEQSSCPIILWQTDYVILDEPAVVNRWLPKAQYADIYLGKVQDPAEQMWYKERNINFVHWAFDVAPDLFDKEYDESLATLYPGSHYPVPIDLGIIFNWVHDPFRMKFVYDLQQIYPDLQITTQTMNEFVNGQSDGKVGVYPLKNVHHPLFCHAFNKVVGLTKINLALDWKIIEGYWSNRVARLMAAGGFVLAHYVKGMEKTFGDNIAYFNSLEDCARKIEYYLAHDEERREIAERGYRFAKEQLTPEKRVKELLIYLENL